MTSESILTYHLGNTNPQTFVKFTDVISALKKVTSDTELQPLGKDMVNMGCLHSTAMDVVYPMITKRCYTISQYIMAKIIFICHNINAVISNTRQSDPSLK